MDEQSALEPQIEEDGRKKKKKKRKIVDESAEEPDTKSEVSNVDEQSVEEPEVHVIIKSEVLDIDSDEIVKEEPVDRNTTIKDLYRIPKLYEVTADIQSACIFILGENVPV